jgi:hypothetical protein
MRFMRFPSPPATDLDRDGSAAPAITKEVAAVSA